MFMIKKVQIAALALLLILLLVSCAPQATVTPAPPAPAPPQPAPAPTTVAPAAPAKPAAWQVEWERVLAEAKKEGRVVFCSGAGTQARMALVQGLKSAYGINADAISGRLSEIHAKILAERRIGLYLWDARIAGFTSALVELKPVGALDPLEPAFILPDVTDPELIKKTWYKGELWWVDRDHTMMSFIIFPQPAFAVNTNAVRPDEIKSYNNLLDPKWKGKISINDPTTTGSTFAPFMMHLFGADWLRKLVTQEPVVTRDQRLQLDWLAQGKFPIALGMLADGYIEFKNAGAPVQSVTPQEGTWLSASSGGLAIFNRPAHPNATKVFVNWLLSKEAQTAFSRGMGGQSARLDVPTDFLFPEQIRQPGVKYWEKEREDVQLAIADQLKLFKEIFAPVMK